MNARTFLHATLVLVALVSLAQIPSPALAADPGQPQHYEPRVYSTKSEEQQSLVSDYWQNAAIVQCELGSDAFTAAKAKSKFVKMDWFGKKRPTVILQQDHGDTVWFRNVKI